MHRSLYWGSANAIFRDLVGPLALSIVLFEIFRYTVLKPMNEIGDNLDEIDKEFNDAGGEASDTEGGDEYGDDGSYFIAFPGTIQLVQPGPWSRLDPEFQQYQRLAKDEELFKRLHVDAGKWAAEQIPYHGFRFRKLKLKWLRSWTDVSFPDLPPPFYTQSGIEIGDGYIAWAQEEMEPDMAQRIQRTLYPSLVAEAMWDFLRVAFTLGDANEKAGEIMTKHVNLPTGAKVTYDQLVGMTPEGRKRALEQREAARKKAAGLALRLSEQQEKAIDSEGNPPGDGSSSAESTAPPSNQTVSGSPSSEKQKPTTLTEWARKKREDGELSPEDVEAFRAYFQQLNSVQFIQQVVKRWKYAYAVGLFTFRKEFEPIVCPPPKGAIKVEGLVRFEHQNGQMLFDVEMHWDPKTRDFDEDSFKAKLIKSFAKNGKPLPMVG